MSFHTTSDQRNAVVSIKNLSVSFPSCDALRDVSLEIPSGAVFAILGENGAGKTTLIRALTGFIHPNSGACAVLGMDPAKDSLAIRQRIGYVSDAPALYDWMQIGEIGWFAASFYPEGFLDRYRQTISDYQLPENRKIKHLSKGQRAKVALALALGHDPDLLILDEPTSGLDPLVRREFLESMLDRVATGRSVLLSSHQIAEVERVADHIAFLQSGSLRLSSSLQSMRDTMHEVTVTLADSLTRLPLLESPMQVLSDAAEGRQRRMIVRNFSSEIQQWLSERTGIQEVRVRSASLDEVFAAYARGRGQIEAGNKNRTEVTALAST